MSLTGLIWFEDWQAYAILNSEMMKWHIMYLVQLDAGMHGKKPLRSMTAYLYMYLFYSIALLLYFFSHTNVQYSGHTIWDAPSVWSQRHIFQAMQICTYNLTTDDRYSDHGFVMDNTTNCLTIVSRLWSEQDQKWSKLDQKEIRMRSEQDQD